MAFLAPNPTNAAPLPSMNVIDAGVFIPRRSFDRWTMGAKPMRTTLTVALNGTDNVSTLTVTPVPANGSAVATVRTVPFLVQIDSEQMLVTALGTGLNWTATRAMNGTAKAVHAIGAAVLGDAITHIALVGDSTMQGTVGSNDEFAQRFARMMGRTMGGASGLVGRGFRGLWLAGNSAAMGSPGNSLAEWSAPSGSWSLTASNTVDDRAPWGSSLTATGATNVMQWTAPANLTTAAIEIVFTVDSLTVPSYSFDGATWTNVVVGNNNVGMTSRQLVATTLPNGFVQIRAANAAGTGISPNIIGITHYSVAPTFGTTQGVLVHNLGRDAALLSTWARTNTLGSTFAWFDSDAGSFQPDLVVIGPFTNDVGVAGAAAIPGVIANLTTFINRVLPYADVLVMNYCEQNVPRDPVAQAAQRAQTKTLAAALNVGLLDIYDGFGAEGLYGWPACNAAGLMVDNNHCSQAGNNDIAGRLMRALGFTTI